MASPLHDIRVEEQDLSSADMDLEADTGESLEIIAIGTAAGADETVMEVSIGETMMLAFQADAGDDDMFTEDAVHDTQLDILGDLRDMGYDLPTLKVPEGDSFVLSDPDGNGNATVLYREGPAGQWRAGADGGPEGRTRPFITSAQETESVAASSTETFAVETSVNPAQLDDWPWEEDVRADREYDMVALVVDSDNSSGGNITLNGFRLISEEMEFLARSSAFVDEQNAQYPDVQNNLLPLIFPEAITFAPGDDLTLEVQATNANTMSAENAIVNAAIIATRRDVGGR